MPPRPRVLVIDDQPSVVKTIELMLERDYEVLAEREAEEALVRLRRGPAPDVILCDLMMPGMTGEEFLAALRGRAPALLGRLAFISGGAYTADGRRCLSESGRPYLEKPFDRATLEALVRQLAAGS